MSKTNAKHNHSAPAAGHPVVETMASLNGALLEAVLDVQREAVEFIGKRLSADIALQRDMMQIREPAQWGTLQQAWWSATLADYSAQAARLIEVMQRTAQAETQRMMATQSSLVEAAREQSEAFKPTLAAE